MSRFCVRCGAGVPAAVVAPLPAQAVVPHRFTFHGSGGELLLLYVKTFLLSMITLGIYSFWGRTRIRQFFAENTRFDNVAFAYHGTGLELLIGFGKALGVILLLGVQFGVFQLAAGETLGSILGGIVFVAGMLSLVPLAMVGAWRYRLSRTSLRGIRFSFRGNLIDFCKVYFPGLLLTAITFSIYAPFFWNNVRRYYARNAYYGNARFAYEGEGRDLLAPWLIGLLLTPFTLGASMLWFQLQRFNYQWNRTQFQNARFASAVSFGDYFLLHLTNFLLAVFTLGIAMPWVMIRTVRFAFDRVSLNGSLNLQAIAQEFIDSGAAGEGMDTLLQDGATDLGFGM
ncbi:MAG: DUF898 domain-containing protein [Bryobacterales bacterium]|nr:DUF898 domain-containing protein [Bryobacterales bacterium]